MREVGFDLAAGRPAFLSPELAREAQLLVTMGCGEQCPLVPGLRREDWKIPDPKGRPPQTVRAIRDQVREHVKKLIAREGWQSS